MQFDRALQHLNAARRYFAVALVCALLPAAALPQTTSTEPARAALGAQTNVVRATLDNGLRVIIVRDALAPVVATAVNYLVGSNEAPAGFPGTAHAQEHMMFRGSPGLSAEQLANIGSIMGGNFNANTRETLTQYLYTVPADDVDVALHIEAVRMRGVDDTAKQWSQERGAIEQEVAADLSNPGYVLYTQLRALAFAGTPYAHDALGTRPSFDRTTAQMLKHFHDTWYAPNNAILVVVGDVEPQQVLAKVRSLFGAIPRKSVPAPPPVRLEPMHAASLSVPTDQPNGMQMIAMRVPGLDSPDFPALEVLADVLSSRRFSLYGLVPQGKALDADFSLDPLPQAGLAYATASFPAGGDPQALANEIRAILRNVAEHGVPADLVAAAKLQERRETGFLKNSIAGLASVWSDAVALYGLSSPEEDLARIEKVTVADVNRVARQYLNVDEAISAVMLPQGSGVPVATGGGFGGQESISLGEAKPTALPEWANAAVQRLSVPAATTHPVVSHLPNGLTLIVQPEDVSDTVSVFGHVRNRAETETPRGREGVAQLLEQLLSYGSQRLDRLAFERALDDIGARERAGTDFSVQALAEYFEPAVQLLAENELQPALPADQMRIVQGQLAQVVAARNKSPGYLTRRSLSAALFPADDPSLRESTPASVRGLKLADVRAYRQEVFRPDLTTIVVIGKVTAEQATAVIAKYFGGWQAHGPKPDTDLPAVPPNAPRVIAVPDASRVQDTVILAQNLALTRSSPDYYAVQLGSEVLGGGFYSTRLSVELRKERGLVYSVASDLQAGRTRGVYFIHYASDPQNVTQAANIALREVRDLQNTPPGAEELNRVKAMLLRQIPLSEASVDDIAAGFLGRIEFDLPLDEPTIAARRYIELTPRDVQSAFKKWMRPDDMVRVSQGPAP
ncbi:MAG TPA: pitrilysin family protein, partial [Steroidobacteraceae bacterium]|nr:pitrilysin family protein [Steroidobacteraceae bacterium]